MNGHLTDKQRKEGKEHEKDPIPEPLRNQAFRKACE